MQNLPQDTLSSSLQSSPAAVRLSALVVIAAGLITTVASLAGFTWLAAVTDGEFNVMGWYALIIPVGALIVGASAGSGYGIASWWTGRKISGLVLGTVLVLQTAAYAGAQWLEFTSYALVDENGAAVSFIEYYDFTTRSIEFSGSRSTSSSTGPLGVLGYAVRVLELAGFALGGLAAPALLRSKGYCERCSIYMKTRRIGTLPASIADRKIAKNDTAARELYEQELAEAFRKGTSDVEVLARAAESADAGSIRGVLDPHAANRKPNDKLPHRIHVSLTHCTQCHDGWLTCTLMSGHGEKMQSQELVQVALTPAVTRVL